MKNIKEKQIEYLEHKIWYEDSLRQMNTQFWISIIFSLGFIALIIFIMYLSLTRGFN